MGFSPGEFYDLASSGEVHWEGKGAGRIYLWSAGEDNLLLNLSIKEARKAADQLMLLVEMAEDDRL